MSKVHFYSEVKTANQILCKDDIKVEVQREKFNSTCKEHLLEVQDRDFDQGPKSIYIMYTCTFDSNNKPVITGPYAYNFNTLMGIQMTIGAREFDYDRRIKEEQLCNVFGEIAGKKIYKEFQSHKDVAKAKVWCIWTSLDGGDSELNDIMAKVKMFGYM